MTAAFQPDFSAAILAAGAGTPQGLSAWHGHAPERRFDVYRNNVAVGLSGALASRFPVAEKIVGEDFFAAMARMFAFAHPPRSPVLLRYGDDFPDFVSRFEPASGVPYLADVMRLEVARSRAYHAADAEPLDPAAFTNEDADQLAGARAVLHPSAGLVRSRYPIVTIWSMNAGEGKIVPIEDWSGEDALIVRQHLAVQVHRLRAGEAVFFEALAEGGSFTDAASRALATTPAFDLTAALVGLVGSGALAGIDPSAEEETS